MKFFSKVRQEEHNKRLMYENGGNVRLLMCEGDMVLGNYRPNESKRARPNGSGSLLKNSHVGKGLIGPKKFNSQAFYCLWAT